MRKYRILIIFILLIAAFFRLYQLPDLPPGLNFDEAGNGVAAVDILSGSPRIWWQIGGGKEPLWPYLIALSTMILGYIPLTLRLPAALVGTLTVAVVYPLMLTLFHNRQARLVAILTLLGLALSEWHLHFSRLGFRAILLPLLSTLAFYFLWRGFKFRVSSFGVRVPYLLLSSFFVALAIYAYLGARLLPVVLILFFALYWLVDRIGQGKRLTTTKQESDDRRSLFTVHHSSFIIRCFLSVFGLIILFLTPLIVYFTFNPADFVARSTTVSIFNPVWNNGDLIGTAWRTLTLTLRTFIGLQGDPNPLVNLPNQPALSYILAPFFLLGLATSLYQVVWSILQPFGYTPFNTKSHSQGKSPNLLISSSHLFLLCWWSVMLLPAILAPEGAPHHLRLIGTLVPTYAFVALGFVTTTNILIKILIQLPSIKLYARNLAYLLPATCYLLLAFQTYTNYFIRWPNSVDFTLPFDLYATRLASDIAKASANVAYVLPMDIRAAEEARHYTLDYLLVPYRAASYTYVPVDERNSETLLTQAAKGKHELRIVRWTDDKHSEADAKEIVTYLLETTAQPLGRESFPVYDVEAYSISHLNNSDCDPESQDTGSADCNPHSLPFRLPNINSPINVTLDGLLRIDSAYVQPTLAASDGWLPIAVTLAPLAPMDTDYKASLRLINASGERIAQKDRVLLHNFHQGTSLWPHETVNEYYLLPIPFETPPGDYMVVAVIYHPETLAPLTANGIVEVPLGTVTIK